MKAVLEENKMSNKLKIFYTVIILICIISIIVAICIQIMGDKEENTQNTKYKELNEEELQNYKDEFNNIFQNKVNYLENNSYKITKINQENEIVYTGYQNNENKINVYDLDVSIPYINIKNDTIEEYNNQIKDTFEKKAKSILNNNNNSTIYTVKYSAYITNNILSIVIRSTLKEDSNPQRDIIQTYNYDLINQKQCTIQEMIEMRGITKQQANKKIKEEIESVQASIEKLEELGLNVYSRDPERDIYSINNVTEYFMGEDNTIYIIFAYGNENNTSEMDIVVM
jgi:hypothetical protein